MKKFTSILLIVVVALSAVLILPIESSYAATGNRRASLTTVMKDGKPFNHRIEAGQKLYRYDTLQGACANKGFAYMTLYDRNVEKCKIVKVDLETLEVVKVSKPLPVYHASTLTYNTRKNQIVATCCKVKTRRAVFIDPNKLTVIRHKDISLSKKVKGLPRSERKRFKGFTAITYNAKNDCYVGRLKKSGNAIVFDGNLNPKRYIKLRGKNTKLLNQGMDSVGNYIYVVQSFKGNRKYNLVTKHTLSGKYVGRMKFPYGKYPGSELQCIFHDGKTFYAGFYLTTSQNNDTKANHVKRTNKLYRVNNMI